MFAPAESPVRLVERPMLTQNRVGSNPGFLHRVLTTANSFSRLAYAIGKLAWNVGSFFKRERRMSAGIPSRSPN